MSCTNKTADRTSNRSTSSSTTSFDFTDELLALEASFENSLVTDSRNRDNDDDDDLRRRDRDNDDDRRRRCQTRNECPLTPSQQAKINYYLGCQCYRLLKNIKLPKDHLSLDFSLLAYCCGQRLPRRHPSIEELLCEALHSHGSCGGCTDHNNGDDLSCGCRLSSEQRAHIYRVLGCLCYDILRDSDIRGLNRRLLALVCKNQSCDTFKEFRCLLDEALDCDRCQR
ncbi:MAG: hypothetical protein ACRCS6_06390 [Turicibacter sp.]